MGRFAVSICVAAFLLAGCRKQEECRTGDAGCRPLLAALLFTRTVYPERLYTINNTATPQISVYQINRLTGTLSLLQQTSVTGCATISSGMVLDAAWRYLYVACSTVSGPVAQFSIDSGGLLTRLTPDLTGAFGTALGGMCADPLGRAVYVIGGGNVNALLIGSDGRLTLTGSVATGGGTPQQCAVDGNGRYLYSPNSSTNDLGNLRILPNGGLQLIGSPVTGTNGSAQFAVVSGDNSYVYNTSLSTDTVRGFSITQSTGVPVSIAAAFSTGTAPNYIETDPSQRYILVTNNSTANITVFSLSTSTGLLSAVPGSPFALGAGPQAVRIDPSGQFAFASDTTTIRVLRFSGGNLSPVTTVTSSGTITNLAVSGRYAF